MYNAIAIAKEGYQYWMAFLYFKHYDHTECSSTSFRSQAQCDGTTDPNLGPVCGRALGLCFNNRKNQLYIADAYYGLLMVGSTGGLATQVATSAEGVPFTFLDAVDIDQRTEIVYFTDASGVYHHRYIF